MTFRTSAVALAAITLLAVPVPASAAKRSKPVVREFTGTVASVSDKGKSFRLRRTGRAGVVVKISRKTKVAKGAKPRKGRKLVVKARRSKKGWQARSVKLVPVVSGEEDALDEEPLEGDQGEESEDGLDLEDTIDDILGGEDDDSGEEPEE